MYEFLGVNEYSRLGPCILGTEHLGNEKLIKLLMKNVLIYIQLCLVTNTLIYICI